MSKTRIAVLISLLLAVPAGMAALEQSGSSEAKEVTVTEQTTVVAEPVAAVSDSQSTTVIAEPIAVERTVSVTAEAPREPSYTMASLYKSSWPQGSFDSEYTAPLPRQAAWLEQRDAQRQPMHASLGKGFPDGSANSDEFADRMLPRQVAYFERIEQQRFASSRPQPVASTESSAQAGSAEVAMADTSAIR